jgi:hypothetical protein
MVTVEELVEMAKGANGRRRQRIVGRSEARDFAELLADNEKNPDVHSIRVYSRDGFVANSYNYPVVISVFNAQRNATTGEWKVDCRTVDAKRARSQGALTTINGRG